MASTAISAQGTTLQCATGAAPTVPSLAVGNLISYSGFDGEGQDIDITNLSSTAKEKLVGLQDFGQFSGNWHPFYGDAGQDEMRTFQASGAQCAFLVTFKDGATAAFTGVVKNAQAVDGAVDGVHGGSFSVAISGDVTITPAP